MSNEKRRIRIKLQTQTLVLTQSQIETLFAMLDCLVAKPTKVPIVALKTDPAHWVIKKPLCNKFDELSDIYHNTDEDIVLEFDDNIVIEEE